MSLWSDISKGLLGSFTGGLGGGVAGAALGLLGMGGKEQPYGRQTTNLRPLSAGEQGTMDNALSELRRLTSSGQGYDPKLYEALYGPYKAALEKSYAKRVGDMNYMFKSTGGGPSSVLNSQTKNLQAGMADDLKSASGNFMTTASNLTNSRIGSLQGLYQGILGGSQIGATTEMWAPNDNRANALAMGMDALGNKDSWWNKGGSDKVSGWMKKLLGGGGGMPTTDIATGGTSSGGRRAGGAFGSFR